MGDNVSNVTLSKIILATLIKVLGTALLVFTFKIIHDNFNSSVTGFNYLPGLRGKRFAHRSNTAIHYLVSIASLNSFT